MVQHARPGEVMVLDRPVHRAFNLVVVDAPAWCRASRASIPRGSAAPVSCCATRRRRAGGLVPRAIPCSAGDPAGRSGDPVPLRARRRARRERALGANRRLLGLLDNFPGDGARSRRTCPAVRRAARRARRRPHAALRIHSSRASEKDAPPPPPFATSAARIPFCCAPTGPPRTCRRRAHRPQTEARASARSRTRPAAPACRR